VDSSIVARASEDLKHLHGVTDAAIELEGAVISAVHLVSNGRRTEKLLVRDAVSLLKARFGVDVDYRKVSVVSFSSESLGAANPAETNHRSDPAPAPASVATEPRVSVVSITVKEASNECRAEVVLGWGDREVGGAAHARRSRASALRVAATSAANALERLVNRRYRIEVMEVRTAGLGAWRSVNVILCLTDGRAEIPLLGSSFATDDIRRAAVYATLDAINRQLGRLEPRAFEHYEVGPTSSP
jgi:hypothetical protein